MEKRGWAIVTGNGTINATTGVYTAPAQGSGTTTINASSGGIWANATINYGNLAPTALNVTITGTAQVGQTLTGSYTYADAENDPEGASLKKWYRSSDATYNNGDEVEVANATSSYTLVGADEGKYIFFVVTPVAQTGTTPGAAVESAAKGPVVAAGSPGVLTFAQSSYSVNEGAGTVTISITRTGGTNGAVSVDYATGGGTATTGTDYTGAYGTLSWTTGNGDPKYVTITIVNDSVQEPNETFVLTLSNPQGGATIGSPNTTTVTIVDNDTVVATVTASDPTASEAGLGTGTFTITLSNPSSSTITVSYSIGGSATVGLDYQNTLGWSVTFAPGETTKTIVVIPIDDAVYEGNETVTLTLSPGTGYTVGSVSSAVVTIVDNESAPVVTPIYTYSPIVTSRGVLPPWYRTSTVPSVINTVVTTTTVARSISYVTPSLPVAVSPIETSRILPPWYRTTVPSPVNTAGTRTTQPTRTTTTQPATRSSSGVLPPWLRR